MIATLAHTLTRWSARWVPDPFVLAILLTLVTFATVFAVEGTPPLDAVGLWGGGLGDGKEAGLWRLLTFTMQVVLTLVTGYALAAAPAVRAGIGLVARAVPNGQAAIVATCVVSMFAGWLNWGLGLIVGAMLAREMGLQLARRGIPVHYPLLGAAGYCGLLVWHGGLSGSATLKVTTARGISEVLPEGVVLDPIPLSATLGSPLNLGVSAALLVVVPLLLLAMVPRASDLRDATHFDLGTPDVHEPPDATSTPAARLGESRIVGGILAFLLLGYLVALVSHTGLDRVGLNTINLLFLGLGVLLHQRPRAYRDAVTRGVQTCADIILQYPLYAGIMGLMAGSGLTRTLAVTLSSVATPETAGLLTFLSAGVVNLFVPSGGGQFAVQGSVVVDLANHVGMSPAKAILAFCYGDQWTNLLQPFWALPLLGITGLKVGDLIGYTALLMVLVFPVFAVALVFG